MVLYPNTYIITFLGQLVSTLSIRSIKHVAISMATLKIKYPLVIWHSYWMNMAIYSEFSHSKWWFSIAMFVYQRVLLKSSRLQQVFLKIGLNHNPLLSPFFNPSRKTTESVNVYKKKTMGQWENHRKTIGKQQENEGLMAFDGMYLRFYWVNQLSNGNFHKVC